MYIMYCGLKPAHEEHDWYEEKRDDYADRHCNGKSKGQRNLELNHERNTDVIRANRLDK